MCGSRAGGSFWTAGNGPKRRQAARSPRRFATFAAGRRVARLDRPLSHKEGRGLAVQFGLASEVNFTPMAATFCAKRLPFFNLGLRVPARSP